MNIFSVFKRPIVILILALIVGFILRFLLLTNIPPGFNWDEASVAYNGYSLAQTGKDEFGRSWPLIIESFGDYKTGLYSILLVPFIKIFGLSVFVARFPNVLVGVLTIFASYYFASQYFEKKYPAALVALLVAISPWAIHTSRFVLEWHLGIPLAILAGAFLLQTKAKPRRLLLSALFFAGSLYFYHSLRLFIPLLLFTYLVFNKNWFWHHQKETIFSIIVGGIVITPFLTSAISNNIFARPQAVSIFNTGNAGQAKEGWYRQTVTRTPIFLLVNNKVVVYSQEFISRYLAHFSPQFLFTGQQVASPRTAVEKVGLLYLISLPFLLLGLYTNTRKFSDKNKFALAWFLLAPVASSLSQDSPHELRSLIFLPILQVFTVSGLLFCWRKLQTHSKLRQKSFISLVVAAYFVELIFFLNRYYLFYPEETARYWQTGQEEMVQKVMQLEPFFDHIIVTTGYGQPHIFLAFFAPIDPKVYQTTVSEQKKQFNGRLKNIGKFVFKEPSGNDLCQESTLVITTHKGLDQSFRAFDTLVGLDRFHKPNILFKFYASSDPKIKTLCAQNS